MTTVNNIDSMLRLLADFRRSPRVSDTQLVYALDFHIIHDLLWPDQPPKEETHRDSLPQIVEKVFREEKEHPEVSPTIISVIQTVRDLTPDLMRYLKRQPEAIDQLPWDVFEKLVAEFFASWGFEEVSLVGRNPETAADVFAAKALSSAGPSIRVFVEVKHGQDAAGVEVIDRVYGAMVAERPKLGWHSAMVVSRVGFRDFRKYTKRSLSLLGVELRDRQDLVRWLSEYQTKNGGLWLPRVLRSFSACGAI